MKAVYTNTTVDFGTSDVGPLVLGIKNAGADATYLPMVASTNVAVVQGLQQNGVDIKANILATGYGQALLDSPAASTLGPNTLLWQGYVPVELKTKATKQYQADLKKYGGINGVPDYGDYLGYITGDMAVLGLQQAGQEPDPAELRRQPAQGRHLRRRRAHVHQARHQPGELRQVRAHELRLLRVREGRQVRHLQQGQAGAGQVGRRVRPAEGQLRGPAQRRHDDHAADDRGALGRRRARPVRRARTGPSGAPARRAQ